MSIPSNASEQKRCGAAPPFNSKRRDRSPSVVQMSEGDRDDIQHPKNVDRGKAICDLSGDLRPGLRQTRRSHQGRRALHDRLWSRGILPRTARCRSGDLLADARSRAGYRPIRAQAADRRWRYRLRRPAERSSYRPRLREGRGRSDPARRSAEPQEMRPHAGPARDPRQGNDQQAEGRERCALVKGLPDHRPHRCAHVARH